MVEDLAVIECGQALFNQDKVLVKDIKNEFPNCHMYIGQAQNYEPVIFVSAGGDLGMKEHDTAVAQDNDTQEYLGAYKIINMAVYRDGYVIHTLNDKGLVVPCRVFSVK